MRPSSEKIREAVGLLHELSVSDLVIYSSTLSGNAIEVRVSSLANNLAGRLKNEGLTPRRVVRATPNWPALLAFDLPGRPPITVYCPEEEDLNDAAHK